jgi:hypothetical protein
LPASRWCSKPTRLDVVAETANYCQEIDIYTLDGWRTAEQGTELIGEWVVRAIDAWVPDEVVLHRATVILETIDFPSMHRQIDDGVTGPTPMKQRKVSAKDGRAFTMEELLHHVRRVYAMAPDYGTRIFEGLRLEKPGVYSINTGS